MIAAVLCLLTAVAPWVWARITGIGITTLAASVAGFLVVGLRTDEDLLSGVDVTLASGGALIAASSLVFWVATAAALVGLRRPPSSPDPVVRAKGEGGLAVGTSGKAVAALVLGIVALPMQATAGLAVAFAVLAFDDIHAAAGRLGGRGMAVAGLVLGIVALAIWCLGLTLAMFLTTP